MTGYEIVILAAGLIFLIASFFFGGKNGAGESVDTDAEIRKIKEAAVLHENEVRDRVRSLLENECGETIADAQEKLSQISNDKIIAIDEYASQVLEKIENNNQAVVFLYDMLQKKEDEMKSTMNKMEQTRRENKELFDRLEELKQAKARVVNRNAGKTAAEAAQTAAKTVQPAANKPQVGRQTAAMTNEKQTVVRNEMPQGTAGLSHTQAEALTEAVAQQQNQEPELPKEADSAAELFAEQEPDRQEQVLSMYKEHKTIKEISKQLSMGQGEVKLIIDLYAKKSE